MSREIIIDNEFVTSWVYPESKIIRHRFHKFTYGENFRNLLTKSTDAFIEKECNKWLSDDRNAGVIHYEDKKWADENWMARIIGAGWKYWALTLPLKTTGQMSMKDIIDQFSKLGVTIKIFTDPEEGMAWLEQQK